MPNASATLERRRSLPPALVPDSVPFASRTPDATEVRPVFGMVSIRPNHGAAYDCAGCGCTPEQCSPPGCGCACCCFPPDTFAPRAADDDTNDSCGTCHGRRKVFRGGRFPEDCPECSGG